MDNLKFVTLNFILAVVFLLLHQSFIPQIVNLQQRNITIDFDKNLFTQFNLNQDLKEKYYNDDPVLKKNFEIPNMGLKNNDNYCEQVDYQNVVNPPKSMNFITDYNIEGLPRQTMKNIGYLSISDKISKDMPVDQWNSRLYDIPLNGTIIFTKKIRFHYFHRYHKQFFCQTQMYNHIPGHGSLTRKDLNVKVEKEFEQQNQPPCYKSGKFFPKSYRLEIYQECKNFFDYINGDEYREIKKKEPVVFITKISWGSSRGNGVEIVDDKREIRLRRKYANGKLCGKIMDSLMAQQYILNPLTLNGHKFDFRIYMLISSTNPLTVFYHDGFLRVSLLRYNKNSTEKSVHFTNTALSKKIMANPDAYKDLSNLNITEDDIGSQQMWSMEKLSNFLYENNKTNDKNWLENYLKPEFKKAFTQLVLMTKKDYLVQPNVFELFGLDFMLDEDLNLWFIECNASPVFQATSHQKFIFQTNLLKDAWEIENKYLQSRLKRLNKFYTDLKRINQTKFSQVEFDYLRRELRRINRNYLEPDIQIRPESEFHKIIDYSLKGTERFMGNFPQECFNHI